MANLTIPAGTKIAFRAGKTKDQAVADKIANQIANLNLCTTKELYINGERVGLTDAEATKLAGSASGSDLTALTQRVTAVETKNTQQDNSINGLTTRVGTAEGNITRLQSDQETNTSDIEELQTFVTVPFDGYETGAVTVQEMGTPDPVSIVYVAQKKCFAAKDAAGKFYSTWKASEGIPAPECYFTVPTSPHAKKLYVYDHELYDIDSKRPVPLTLILGQPITVQATGNDDTRSISQRLFTQEIAKYAALSSFNALAARVAALEAQLKLA